MIQPKNKLAGAGVILVRIVPHEEPRYLLLCGTDTNVWSFAKGHPEDIDDSPRATAIRETFEETGYICDKDYSICGTSCRFGKRPYWLGLMLTNRSVTLTEREHSRYGWFSASEIRDLNTNYDVRQWVQRIQSDQNTFMRAVRMISAKANAFTSLIYSTPDMHSNVPAYSAS
jgi:8-oxo-dGTP pyrophosphatase MutT (NUDIX family)